MNGTALIVDDTPTNVQVLAQCLASAGLSTLAAKDGESALEQLKHAAPDIILLDVMMPGIDGFEACRRIKADPSIGDIPVIFMTGVAEVSNMMRGFEVGAVDYITKPYHHGELISRVTTQITLRRQRLELMAALEQRDRFMSIAAHDLRNPLAVVLAWTELALNEAGETGQRSLGEMLQRIQTAARRTEDIIEDFLSLQVIRGEAPGQGAAPFDLGRVVEQVVDQHRFAAEKKRMELRVQLPALAGMALGEMARANQMVTNYVSNAVKFSPPGTVVEVSLRPGAGGPRVEVQDRGPGVPPAHRTSLFVEFAKIPSKPTGDESSTGLGLAIVKHLAEMQGGRVGAEFPEEGGSIFWFELPAASSSPG